MPKGEKRQNKTHHKEESAHELAVEESLSIIYGDERDDLQTVAHAPGRLTRFLVRSIIFFLLLLGVSVVSMFVYRRFFVDRSVGKPLAISFDIPEEFVSGQMVDIDVLYANTSNAPLTSVTLDVNMPPGFVPSAVDPFLQDPQSLSWDLGTLAAKSDGVVHLQGLWEVDVPSTTGIQVITAYKPANFNAEFHDIAGVTVTTSSSTTVLTVDAPEAVHAGSSATYTIHVRGTEGYGVNAPHVVVSVPEGFVVTESAPTLEPGGGIVWNLPDVLPGEEALIVFTGTFASHVSGVQTMSVASGRDGLRFSSQAMVTVTTDVLPSAVAVTVAGNGGVDHVSVEPGADLRLSARIQNQTDEAIDDVEVLFDFAAEDNIPLVWRDAVLHGGVVTAKGIVYSAKTVGTIAPGGYTIVTLTLPVVEDLMAVSSEFTLAVSVTHENVTSYASLLTVSVNSDAQLVMTSRYYDDDGSPLGHGDLPPVVGETTVYRVTWAVSGGSHALRDIRVVAPLPDGVMWDGFSLATAGTVSYDPNTRIVTWIIAELPAGAATALAQMNVAFTPKSTQSETVGTIMGKATMTATDERSTGTIERQAEEVTTQCIGDQFASGKGVIQPAQ